MIPKTESRYADITLHLLQGLSCTEIASDLRLLCRFTRSVLTILRRAKAFLRIEPQNAIWQQIRSECVHQLEALSQAVQSELSNMELDSASLVALLETAGTAAAVLYEERLADLADSKQIEISPDSVLSPERLQAMEKLFCLETATE